MRWFIILWLKFPVGGYLHTVRLLGWLVFPTTAVWWDVSCVALPMGSYPATVWCRQRGGLPHTTLPKPNCSLPKA